jgi:hypothetical protein
VVLIPDLMAGWVLPVTTSGVTRTYTFPIFIPSGTRLSARSQSVVASKTCSVGITLLYRPTRLGYVGTRVTAYGVTSASSYGTLHTAGNTSTYGATAGQLSASTTNPIRYMQVGIDCSNRTICGNRIDSGLEMVTPSMVADKVTVAGASSGATVAVNGAFASVITADGGTLMTLG